MTWAEGSWVHTTPLTHACAVRFMDFCAETKFKKGASDRNSPPVVPVGDMVYHFVLATIFFPFVKLR